MGINGFETEAQAIIQELMTEPLCEHGGFITVSLRIIREGETGQLIGIDKGQTQGLKGEPVKGALAGPIATHKHPELGCVIQLSLNSQDRNSPLAKRPTLRLPSLSSRSK